MRLWPGRGFLSAKQGHRRRRCSGYVQNLREVYENYDDPRGPFTALWQRFTAKPRETYEFDGIAWGEFPDADPDDNLTVEAVELREAGDLEGAHELLAMTFVQDLRCLDAHAHLGNWLFRRSPERAILHYEVGMRIGEAQGVGSSSARTFRHRERLAGELTDVRTPATRR